MASFRRRLSLILFALISLALILYLADVELAKHQTRTSTSVTLLGRAPPERPTTLAVFVQRTEPPFLGEALGKPLTQQLEARGISVKLLAKPPSAWERPAISVSLRAAPLSWTPLRASATVTARVEVQGDRAAKAPTARTRVEVTDSTSGLTSRQAYLRHLAEAMAAGIAVTLTESMQGAASPAP